MATREKNTWVLLLFICCGLVIGGLIGQMAAQVEWLNWLAYGQEFGIESPFVLNLNIIKLTFAFTINVNISSIIGLAVAIFIYRKV